MSDRTEFANAIYKLIWDKHGGVGLANNLKFTINHNFHKDVLEMRNHLYENVRNIYELENEIPLLAFANYLKHGYDELRFDEEDEMTETKWLQQLLDSCINQYSVKMV